MKDKSIGQSDSIVIDELHEIHEYMGKKYIGCIGHCCDRHHEEIKDAA